MGIAGALGVTLGVLGLVVFLAYLARLGARQTPAEKEGEQIQRELVEVRHLLEEAGVPPSKAPVAKPQKLTRIHVEGRVVVVRPEAAVLDEPLPPWKHGEMPKDGWAGSGHLFVVGYRYTGAPGEDTGVIWHRWPDGRWTVDLERLERPLVGVTGDADRVWVVGGRELWTYDGTNWTLTTAPETRGMSQVRRLPDGDLVTVSYDGLIRRFDGTTWHDERPLGGRALYALGGEGERLFTGGDGGILLSRGADGRWADEFGPGKGQVRAIATAREGTFAAAGAELWRRDDAGTWVAVPGPAWVSYLGAAPDGTIRVGADKLYAFDGDELVVVGEAWARIAALDGDTLYQVYEKHTETEVDG